MEKWEDRLKVRFGKDSGRLPDFLCIGAQRAGTTWLYEMLLRHPEIYMPEKKELHFFDEKPDFSAYQGAGKPGQRFFYTMTSATHWKWYRQQFNRGKKFNILGEVTPFYATLSEQRVSLIAEKLNPLKIIYIIRNPVQRAWSAFRRLWYLETGHNNHPIGTDIIMKTVMFPANLTHGDYQRNIAVYEKYFPANQILYLLYDDIVQVPHDILRQVWNFFDVKTPSLAEKDIRKQVNTAPRYPIPEAVEAVLTEYFDDQMSFIHRKFGRTLTF